MVHIYLWVWIKSVRVHTGINLLVCIYKPLYNRRKKIAGSCWHVARYHTPIKMPDWLWWTPSDVSFTYNPFKTYWLLKWINDLALTEKIRIFSTSLTTPMIIFLRKKIFKNNISNELFHKTLNSKISPFYNRVWAVFRKKILFNMTKILI